jgi:hypothetical protein
VTLPPTKRSSAAGSSRESPAPRTKRRARAIGNRRCPPGVFTASTRPWSIQRLTVDSPSPTARTRWTGDTYLPESVKGHSPNDVSETRIGLRNVKKSRGIGGCHALLDTLLGWFPIASGCPSGRGASHASLCRIRAGSCAAGLGAGYLPRALQKPEVLLALRAPYALVPSLWTLLGFAIALADATGRASHAAIRAGISARRAGGVAKDPLRPGRMIEVAS